MAVDSRLVGVPLNDIHVMEQPRLGTFITIGVEPVMGGFRILVPATATSPERQAVALTPKQAAKRAAEILVEILKENVRAASGGG
jgi:hypothetical protein